MVIPVMVIDEEVALVVAVVEVILVAMDVVVVDEVIAFILVPLVLLSLVILIEPVEFTIVYSMIRFVDNFDKRRSMIVGNWETSGTLGVDDTMLPSDEITARSTSGYDGPCSPF